ncbi:MAG TPA: transglycosylase domain-containing protein, partial [Thermoleophilia bacterium]|nr:transglycosylase domain-containing protein [Thermoleophilia bacterium]
MRPPAIPPEEIALRRRRRRRLGRWFVLVLLAVLALPLLAAAGVAGAVLAVSRGTPPLAALLGRPQSQDTILYDSSGRVIARLHGAVNRVVVPSSAIPQTMKDATVAIEDRRFYEHHGVDFIAVARAAVTDLLSGHIVQGASTITEQYVKNAYLGTENGFLRKIREGVLAWELEDSWSKDRILTAYLNTVYYGDGAYGVQAAAQTFFHENVSRLTLAQSALLAGLPQDPGGYSPVYDPADALARRDLVLAAMRGQGYISAAQEAAATHARAAVFAAPPPSQNAPAAYFVQYVIDQLVKRYGVSQALDGGLKVHTTLDLRLQHDALAAMKSTLPAGPAGALVSIDPATGFIRAMTASTDWRTTKFDLAWQAHRQLGSAMKPFALTAAVEEGANPATTYYTSQPLHLFLGPHAVPPYWNVSTFSGTYAGPINLVDATWQSDNTVYAQLALDVGPRKIVAVAHRMGISSPLAPYPSIVLGTEVVNPLEVADAYATFAAEGIHHAPQAIQRVRFADGTVRRAKVVGKRVVPAGVAYVVDKILEGNTRFGTAAAMPSYYTGIAAGKTGTTENSADAWFCGFDPK